MGRPARSGGRTAPVGSQGGKAALFRELQETQFRFFRNEFSIKFAVSPAQGQKNIVVNVTPDLLSTLQ